MPTAMPSDRHHRTHQIFRSLFISGVAENAGVALADDAGFHHFLFDAAFFLGESAGVRSAMPRLGFDADALRRVFPFWSTL
jgi:hypothetical protein